MRQILIQEDAKLVEAKLIHFEKNTGCDLLLIIANASDPYPAASLRFGMIAGFLITLVFSYYLEFHEGWMWPLFMLIISSLMTWVGHVSWAKRLALSDREVARECAEKGLEYFHTLGTSKVSHKVTAMIMISSLEKNIQLLVDEKLKTQITQQEMDELIALMKEHFKKGNVGLGLISSIQRLEDKIVKDFGGKVSEAPLSELSDTIHFINI